MIVTPTSRSAAAFVTLVSLVLGALAPPSAVASGSNAALQRVCGQIGAAAAKAGAKEAQFLQLVDMKGDITPAGRELSARLLHCLLAQSAVSVVLGELPDSPLEPYLNLMGPAAGQAFRKQIVAQAAPSPDLMILGSYLVRGRRVRLNVQAIVVATRRIIVATDDEFETDWPDEPAAAPGARMDEALVRSVREPQDSLVNAQRNEARLKELALENMDIKARYFAMRIRLEGGNLAQKLKPWQVIRDPALRAVFEEKVAYWVAQSRVPPLKSEDLKQLDLADAEAFGLELERLP